MSAKPRTPVANILEVIGQTARSWTMGITMMFRHSRVLLRIKLKRLIEKIKLRFYTVCEAKANETESARVKK